MRVPQDHRTCAAGVLQCERGADPGADGDPEQGRPPGPGGVHHDPDVLDAGVHGHLLPWHVRQAGSPLVEPDQPGERPQAAQETREEPLFPGEVEV